MEDYKLGKEVKKFRLDNKDIALLKGYLKEYCSCFSLNLKEVMAGTGNFVKLIPYSHRPYGKIYAY